MYEVVRAADIHVVGFFTSPREKQANYANAKSYVLEQQKTKYLKHTAKSRR